MEYPPESIEIVKIGRELSSSEIKKVEDLIERRLYNEMCEDYFVGALVQMKPIEQLNSLGYGPGFVLFDNRRCRFPLGIETCFRPYNPETEEGPETVITWEYNPYVVLGMIKEDDIHPLIGELARDILSCLGEC